MSKPLRIAGLDPGKRKDSFAMVVTEVADNEVKIKGVKLWNHRKYIEVEKEIALIQETRPMDFWVLEINNTGEHVFEALVYQRRMTNIIPVFTSRELKDQVKIAAGKVMSKNEIVRFCLKLSQNSREGKKPCITFPKDPSRPMQELERQWALFAEKTTEAGNTTYSAEGDEHDDATMALILAVWLGRHYLERDIESHKPTVSSKNFRNYNKDKIDLGSGAPPTASVSSREEYMP
jgi:hypothetical protein